MKQNSKSITWAVAAAAVLSLAAFRLWAGVVPPTVLPIPDGYTVGMAYAVNANGQIAGMVASELYSQQRACVWNGGVPTVLPTLTGGSSDSYPYAINSVGVVVGYCYNADNQQRAVRWVTDDNVTYTIEDLGVLAGESSSEARAINDQGQILCESGNRWFLWEAGAQPIITEITMADGDPIDAGGGGMFGASGLLSSNGRVAGKADVGFWNGTTWNHEYYQAVLWQKTGSAITVTSLSPATVGSDGDVDAISANGLVAGYSSAGGYFVYDSDTETFKYAATGPSGDWANYYPVMVSSVNDSGQAVFVLEAYDSSTGMYSYELWIWQAGEPGTWTQVPLDSLVPSGNTLLYFYGFINNNGQVAGAVIIETTTGSDTYVGFAWSADKGTAKFLSPSGTVLSLPTALNDSGLAVGAAASAINPGPSDVILPVTWNLADLQSLSISNPTVTTRNGKSFTVTFMISNSDTTTASHVTITACELGGIATGSDLPMEFGTIKPGASKKCVLQFKNLPSGQQTLTVKVNSSLGDFLSTQTLQVP